MKLLINISSLNQTKTGIGHYAFELTKRLLKHPKIQDIVGFDGIKLYSHQELCQRLNQAESAKAATIKPALKSRLKNRIKNHLKSIILIRKLHQIITFKRNQQRLNKFAKQGYLYWEPNYILSPYQGKSFPVIYDLSHIQCPQHHIQKISQWFVKNISLSTSRAYRIQTISQYSKQQIIQLLQISASKIDIIPPGVSSNFYPRQHQPTQQVLSNYGLKHQQYLLSVGTLEPRKNLQGLFLAWQQLPQELRNRYPLVLVGKSGWLNQNFTQQLQPYIQQQQVILTGYIPTAELPYFYSGAKLFAYLSFYEGYGMPIAEAICCGCPVLASNTTAMPEAGKHHANYVSPNKTAKITQALQNLLQLPPSKTNLNHQAIYQAIHQDYSWHKSLAKLIASFENQST